MLVIVQHQNDSANGNSQLVEAVCALEPESHYILHLFIYDFLDVKKWKPLLDLSKTDLVEAEFSVCRLKSLAPAPMKTNGPHLISCNDSLDLSP